MYALFVSFDDRKTWLMVFKTFSEDGYNQCLGKTEELKKEDWIIAQIKRDHFAPEQMTIKKD